MAAASTLPGSTWTALADRQLLDSLSRIAVHLLGGAGRRPRRGPRDGPPRPMTGLLADGIVGRVSHGTAHLPSSQRYYLTAKDIRETAGILGFESPSDFVRAYSGVQGVADAAHPPDGRGGRRLPSRRLTVPRHPIPPFARGGSTAGAASTPPSPSTKAAASAWSARARPWRRSLYDRLRAIAEYDYTRRPDTILMLTPSVWEERLTTRFCINLNLHDCFVAVETRDALEGRDLRLWCHPTWVFGCSYRTLEAISSHGSPGGRPATESPSRKRASIPNPERMAQAAPTFGVSPSEKRTLDLITDHPMIPREHLSRAE